MELYSGTSGWAYATWRPGFYPQGLPQTQFLNFYSQRLNSIEVNYTFRHRLLPSTAQKWLEATPHDFKFSFKAHQAITHFRRLREVEEPLALFLDSLRPFQRAGRLGAVLFQLPENMACDLPRFKDFLGRLPRKMRFAFEFRNGFWLVDEVFAEMRRRGVGLCITRGREELEVPAVKTGDFLYYRLRGNFRSYKAELFLRELQRQEASVAFVYFKHEETPTGARRAMRLLGFKAPGAEPTQ